ncbi:GNAT family N-acetyltransferase [Halorarum halobium]|uniref:GNAT family N-acetyltransferase n=1 Tax=Halorarum halobium TaxID=3075121 RepID=UPI0028A75834|nr:GNAT family N-acetyltransferase [Halobaculum sp. XH14]
MRLETLSLDEWGDALPASGFEAFHAPAALDVLGDHAEGELRLYGGFKGDRPVGLFPAFVRERSVGTAVTSPPPGFAVPQLGPIVMPASPKRRKREKVNAAFAGKLVDEFDVDGSLTLFRTVCNTAYPDPRPYVWNDLDLDVQFTYRLAVDEDPDDLLTAASKSLRREIGDARDLDVTVRVEGREGTREVFEHTADRYDEQDRGFSLTWPYVRDLTEALAAEDRCRTYVARGPDDEFLTGVVALYSNDAAYYWLGGARTTHEGVSVNSLVHWTMVEDVAAGEPRESVHSYDLMGANTERLCRYKSKFGAELAPYYVLESGGPGMDVAKRAYRLVAR